MIKFELLSTALRNLLRRKLRTFLTVLSVTIGSISIIMMGSFGLGIKKMDEEMLNSFGDVKNITVMTNDYHGMMGVMEDDQPLDKEGILNASAIEEFKNLDHVEVVMPVFEDLGHLSTKKYDFWQQVEAIDFSVAEKFGYQLDNDVSIASLGKKDIILGADTATEAFNPRTGDQVDPALINLGNQITLKSNYASTGEGEGEFDFKSLYEDKLNIAGTVVAGSDWKLRYTSFISIEKAEEYMEILRKSKEVEKDAIPKKGQYNSALIRVDDVENVESVQNQVQALGFRCSSLLDEAKAMENQTKTIQYILLGIGSIAFIVASIGIMNTMVMAIYERVKEIGVMKVIGASVTDIKAMFLAEAALIGFFGGLLGALISLAISNFINGIYQQSMGPEMIDEISANISYLPAWLFLLGIGFSAIVGLLAGYIPAVRATKISAIDAIRSN